MLFGLFFQLFALAAELHAQDLRGRGAIPISASIVEQWAKSFGLDLYSTATTATQAEELEQKYQEKNARVEYFDPEEVIDVMKARLEKFLGRRRQLAEILKENLENSYSLFQMVDREAINDLQSDDFYRFVDSKSCLNRHYVDPLLINSSLSVSYIPNPNFFNLPVNTEKSAIHVPTPVYARDPELLSEIIWTESLDDIFKARRAREFFAASWQYFCSQKGFMRFYPASPWFYDDSHTCLDMYDCRNSEWYIDAATHAKNIIIMLDMSGSMLGQRFEIAKQTIEMILETLTENDFFNMIVFSEEPKFILSCFRNRLVQATIKNKKLMRVTLDNVTAEGIANYPAALSLAFEVLIEASQNPGVNSGCQNAIMLITDGPSDTYEDIFEKYNKDKTIRFFTYLIGDDVTETREVRWMACYNRGYFAHISNLADVQEKVQSYIGVMSRLTSERNRTDPVWTGAYYDRLGAVLVATVAFPVVANDSFRGVVGASALITELQQMAPLYMLGTHSYTFIVDNNGYVVHHPQLRPLYMGKAKPHYNSMDIMEMEVLADNYLENGSLANPVDYDSDLRRHLADGVSSKDFLRKFSQKIIWACDGPNNLRRVYLQNNVYHYRGINNTLMSLALAVPEDSRYRIALPSAYSPYPYKNIDFKWFSGTNWRLHPDWHYCRINDSDYSMTKEEAFVINMKHYSETGRIARNCALYTYLIERLLFDAEVTSQMDSAWIQESRLDERKGVHLVYLATHAGLTRFVSMDLKDVQYQPDVQTWPSDDNRTEELPTTLDKPYFHFSKRHTRALDEVFYKRAMQFLNGEFVFDVNITNNIYLKNGSQTYPHAKDGRSIIVTGNRAILVRDDYGNEAPASVVGFEMLYASFEEMIYNASHKMCHFNSKVRCYLLDEHGYIVYASLPHTSQERVHYLRQFFGHLSLENTDNGAIERYLMKKLVDLFVYQKLLYVDFQDLCQNLNLYNSARRLFNPLLAVSKLIISMLQKMIRFFLEINPLAIIFSLFSRASCYTATFRDIQDGLPCDRASSFYLLNNDFKGPLTLAEGKQLCSSVATSDSYARVSSCNLYAYAVRIEKTNLVLVVYSTEGTQCNGDLCKDYFSRDSLPWGFNIALNATDKVMHPQACKLTTRYRRPPSACQAVEDDDPFAHCSGCSSQATLSLVLLCTAVLFVVR